MRNEPLVSIIIPLYNREKIVRASVESCIVQTYKNIEVIIVDDASTDQSVKVIRELMQTDHRIRLIENKKNMKLGYTRNVGIAAARGELLAFLDSDDLILENKIEKCVAAYQVSNADCINSPVISKFYSREDEISQIVPGKDPIRDYLKRRIVWKVIGPLWSKKFIDRIGWFVEGDEVFGSEDFELHLRAIIEGAKVHYLQEPLSVQVNVDPSVDTVKIRQAEKFETLARKKIYSRVLVFKQIMRSNLSFRSKVKYAYLIIHYLASLMKNSFNKISFSGFVKLNGYLVGNLFRSHKRTALSYSHGAK